MTAVFTNRLIGSAILVVAAVVFLPDLLDGQKQVRKDDFKVIPERPEFASVAPQQVYQQDQHLASRAQALALPVDDSPVLDQTDPQPVPQIDQSLTTAAASDQVQTNVMQKSELTETVLNTNEATENTVPVKSGPTAAEQAEVVKKSVAAAPLTQAAWVVKVGSFGQEQNANQLMEKLQKAGYATFTRKVTTSNGTNLVSVLVGPDLKKEKLENSLQQLQILANVKALKVVSFQPIENN